MISRRVFFLCVKKLSTKISARFSLESTELWVAFTTNTERPFLKGFFWRRGIIARHLHMKNVSSLFQQTIKFMYLFDQNDIVR